MCSNPKGRLFVLHEVVPHIVPTDNAWDLVLGTVVS